MRSMGPPPKALFLKSLKLSIDFNVHCAKEDDHSLLRLGRIRNLFTVSKPLAHMNDFPF